VTTNLLQRAGNSFSNYWVAGPNEKINMVVDSVRDALEIDQEQVVKIKVQSQQVDIVSELLSVRE